MDELSERAYLQGMSDAYRHLLQECIRHLGGKDDLTDSQRGYVELLAERSRAIAALREVCATHGDNDWPDELDLSDIINKHLDLE